MLAQCEVEYISVGGNRHPAAADWDRHGTGILAFGADNNVALWKPLVCLDLQTWETLNGFLSLSLAVGANYQ